MQKVKNGNTTTDRSCEWHFSSDLRHYLGLFTSSNCITPWQLTSTLQKLRMKQSNNWSFAKLSSSKFPSFTFFCPLSETVPKRRASDPAPPAPSAPPAPPAPQAPPEPRLLFSVTRRRAADYTTLEVFSYSTRGRLIIDSARPAPIALDPERLNNTHEASGRWSFVTSHPYWTHCGLLCEQRRLDAQSILHE